jgi:hypothetical protein
MLATLRASVEKKRWTRASYSGTPFDLAAATAMARLPRYLHNARDAMSESRTATRGFRRQRSKPRLFSAAISHAHICIPYRFHAHD